MRITKSSTLSAIALALASVIASATVSAGEVTVVSSDGLFVSDITITGSPANDSVTVRRNASGNTIIIGNRGTTINFNGSTVNRVDVGLVSNLSISLRAGADRLRVRDVSVGALDIRLGGGNDFARFSNGLEVRESGVLRGGSGRDVVRGGINSLELRSVEVANVFASAFDRGEPTVVASEFVDVVNGANLSSQLSVGESFVVPAGFSGSATISGFDSHGERGLPEDSIDVSAIDADVTRPGNQAFTLVVNFRGNAGELIIPNENDLGGPDGFVVAGDTDGDAIADFTITLDDFQLLQAIGPWFDNFIP